MKTYRNIVEDIELVAGVARHQGSNIEDAHHDARHFGPNSFRDMGKIHKDYSMHKHGHDFFIRHDKTKKIVGHISTESENERGGKKISVGMVGIHPQHSEKKIGHSLAFAAYRHLHRKGYDVHSGHEQSPGGASIWRRLMKHPTTRAHVEAIRHSESGKGKPKNLGRASRLHTGDIWVSGSGYMRKKAGSKGIRMHPYQSKQSDDAYLTRLVLRGKKR